MKRINTISSIFLGLLTAGSLSYSQTTYNFTNAGATEFNGPTQSQINTAYSSTNLNGAVTINTQGIQEWTVPASGVYTIEVWGAQGGNTSNVDGGKGARMKGDFTLTQGTVLQIVVGQQGSMRTNSYSSGGGGGSFVVKKTNSEKLIIAGGGGGVGNSTSYRVLNDINASVSEDGNNGYGLVSNNARGGSSGNGGYGTSSYGGGGGGGFSGNGANYSSYQMGGKSFTNGAQGACLLYTSPSPRDGLLSRMPSSA